MTLREQKVNYLVTALTPYNNKEGYTIVVPDLKGCVSKVDPVYLKENITH